MVALFVRMQERVLPGEHILLAVRFDGVGREQRQYFLLYESDFRALSRFR
jgi:hypothetical protein